MAENAGQEFDGKKIASRLPTRPGVYLMRDQAESALYVGKALNLRKRVSSYFDARPKNERIMRMISRIASIEVSITRTEAEALLLENEWIKSLKPRYNILLRDDKSYPWIALSTAHEFPRIFFHRGARDKLKTYFGPYPSASSVRQSINLIQKLFRIRNCEDSYFSHRNRPCLQYQIRRCTAPCVGLVSADDYRLQVDDASLFLQGKNQKVMSRLIRRMEQAARELEFESAAMFRDQINILKQMQAQQIISGNQADIDFIALAQHQGACCVQVVSIRSGRNLGQKNYFPSQADGYDAAEVMAAFLGQYYQQRMAPAQLVISHTAGDLDLWSDVFSKQLGRKVTIQPHPRGDRRKMLELARGNARQALQMRLASRANIASQFESLQNVLGLEDIPEWIDCFDISHTAGNQTVGSCVVFDQNGPVKSHYRRYNLKGITPGDDYAAMKQVLSRRYERIQAEEVGAAGDPSNLVERSRLPPKGGSICPGMDGIREMQEQLPREAKLLNLPDLVLIDGGKGQLKQAIEVMSELGLPEIALIGVSKGRSRRAGHEEWVLPRPARSIHPGPESPASHLVQQIRDEAHRFAITGHRGRRQKAATRSKLEQIPGIGPKRRRTLLNHFGGLQGVTKAGVEELSSVPGINRLLAEEIFRALH